jgi:hypothetical protein
MDQKSDSQNKSARTQAGPQQILGCGKSVICLDGADLAEAFTRELPFSDVLHRKVRQAAETGAAFVRVRDLF